MNWQKELGYSIKSVEDIEKYKSLPFGSEKKKRLQKIIDKYPMNIPINYLDLIDWENYEEDPIRKLCIPDIFENEESGSFDTSGEASNTVVTGLQHKYKETALMLATSSCAMYCRFCFRKRLVGGESDEITTNWNDIFEYLQKHKEINNVLVSGGDPLLMRDDQIDYLLSRLTQIEHLDFIRIGTRIPVVLPQRILESKNLLDSLEKYNRKKRIYIITHFNHPKEITECSIESIKAIQKIGICIRNQTVLLKGVNDQPEILAQLFSDLTAVGIQPYYLFQCRPVKGVKDQFQVPFIEGLKIVNETRGMLNGLAKSFRYALSHITGKIEILGVDEEGFMIFKYNQAKDKINSERLLRRKVEPNEAWLPEDGSF